MVSFFDILDKKTQNVKLLPGPLIPDFIPESIYSAESKHLLPAWRVPLFFPFFKNNIPLTKPDYKGIPILAPTAYHPVTFSKLY